MTKPAKLVVNLVQVGYLPPSVKINILMRILRAQDEIVFRYVETPVHCDAPESGYYYTEKELFSCLHCPEDEQLIVGITSIRIAPSVGGAANDPENEYFGIWRNSQLPLDDKDARKGVISVTCWRERYEARAFRSTEQYLAFMILAFVGDVQLGGLTHPWCTGCVFDFNPDNESIVSSVKSATLCDHCLAKMRAQHPHFVNPFKIILKKVDRPPYGAILSYLQSNGVTSLLIFTVLLALSVGLLQRFIESFEHVAAIVLLLCSIVFIAIVIYLRRFPMGSLK